MTTSNTTFVLGGARSGKSAFAERLALESGLDPVYVATGTAGDDEMHARIAHHRAQRGDRWRTVEEPLRLAEVIARDSGPTRVLLVDCLTLWLSNVMHAQLDPLEQSDRLIVQIQQAGGPLVLVSNEVGLGIVPETPLGRAFRDAQGRLNQRVAAAVANVVFIAAGLPLWLKRVSY